MEQIITVEEALRELHDKKEDEEVRQFTNPKAIKGRLNGGQIFLRQMLAVLLLVLALLLVKLTAPDIYRQINEYLTIRFGIMP